MDDVPSCQERAREQATQVEFVSNLNMYSTANKMRLSGIVCTIGPVSREPATLLELIENGMNVARMNFSHGSHEYHAQTMANCRTAAKMYKEKHGVDPNLAIALDTKGPEIRTGLLEGDDGRKELTLKAGASIKITTDEAFKEKCTSEVLWLDYKNITKVMEPGKRLFIDDGLISVKCTEIGSDHFIGMIENDGNLGSKKGCNLPGTDTDLPAVSEKDKSESCVWNERMFEDMMRAEGKEKPAGFDNTSTTAISAVLASYKCKASAIVVLTTSGTPSHIVSKYKPHCPILSVTRYGQVARQMQIFRGCIPLLYEKERDADWMKDVDDRVQYAIDFGKRSNFIGSGDNVVVITGWQKGSGSSNTVRILPVS